MDIVVAIILGIVEGITEFLPISSTGHLIVAEKLLGFKDVQDMFTVVIQLGAILAVVWFYRHDLFSKVVGLLSWRKEAVRFWQLLIVATIPAGIIGLLLNDSMDQIAKPVVVATTLIVGGLVLWLVDRKPVPKTEHSVAIEKIPFKKALLIGFGQSVAIVPGVSRSGATIVTSLAAGLNRTTATAFSFYLAIPVMVLASGLKLIQNGDQLHRLSGGSAALLVGIATAFITAFMSIAWLLKYISHHSFRPFAYYRIIAGLAIFGLLAANVL